MTPQHPLLRVVMPGGILHLIRREHLSVAAAEYPQALRIEHAGIRQHWPLHTGILAAISPTRIPLRLTWGCGHTSIIYRLGLSVAAAEHPDAIRIERADLPQPPLPIEDQTDG